jgi:hypothetical protein
MPARSREALSTYADSFTLTASKTKANIHTPQGLAVSSPKASPHTVHTSPWSF